MPVRNESAKIFTSTYDNFIQTAGIRDGASYCSKNLSVFYDNLDTSDPDDPEVIVKVDISNTFNTTCRALTLDVRSGYVSRDYGIILFTIVSSLRPSPRPPVEASPTPETSTSFNPYKPVVEHKRIDKSPSQKN
jgi:hypothetical protein